MSIGLDLIIAAIYQAREGRNFEESGRLQTELSDLGYDLLDNGEGCRLLNLKHQYIVIAYSKADLLLLSARLEPATKEVASIPELADIASLIAQRQQARADKLWAIADQLRDEIQARSGKRLVDSKDGRSRLIAQ